MLVTTKAIVLSKLRYKDHDLIVKCYTEKFGIKSYLVKNAVMHKRGKFKPAYFQLLSVLDIQADHKPNRSLQYLKDIKLQCNYRSLHTNVTKSAIVMFLSDVLSTILKEEEENKLLYHFLETSLVWFDETATDSSFHLKFLIELTKYLGIYPQVSIKELNFFNLEEGKFQSHKTNIYCVTGGNIKVLKQLLGTKFDADIKLEINTDQRREFLDIILLYFKLHLDSFKMPKSVIVLNQVFN